MIEIKELTKTFQTSDGSVDALKDINITIGDGAIFGIIGMSGAGKSTLVRCINMLERPTAGSVVIDGSEMGQLDRAALRRKRRETSMIFQSFNLLMQKTCLQNICFPMFLSGMKKSDAEKRARELLEMVGLPDKANSYPAQLSGGQQQRIAIARALSTDPKVLLCDEATSALDPKTTHDILSLIRRVHDELGITVVMITHQMSVVEEICTDVAILDNGSVAEIGTVGEIFSSPKSDAAKRLVYPEGFEGLPKIDPKEFRLRVMFHGALAAGTPTIAQMAIDEGILANILFASTRSMGDKAYGTMILGVSGTREDVERAKKYLLRTSDIEVQEVG